MYVVSSLRSWNRAGRQCLRQCPAGPKPRLDRSTIHAQSLSPFNHGEAESVMGNYDIRSAVSRLLNSGRPSAILRGIGAIVIDAVQLVTRRWTWPHIGKEVIEESPTVTDCNAPCTVMLVSAGARIQTAGLHGPPDVVFGSVRAAMSQAVCFAEMPIGHQVVATGFTMQAAARKRMTVAQVTQANGCRLSACAAALHKTLSRWSSPNDGEHREASGREANDSRIRYARHWLLAYHCGT